jgi:hypothetical protein
MKSAFLSAIGAAVAAIAAAASFPAGAAHHVFPSEPWEQLKLKRTELSMEVCDGSGRCQLRFLAEPRGHIGEVGFAISAKGVSVDTAKAFASGMKKLVCTSAEIEDASFAGEYVVCECRVAGAPP